MDTITIDAICEDAEYKPKPGLKYEVAEGCVLTMKRPYAAVAERYLELSEYDSQSTNAQARKLEILAVITGHEVGLDQLPETWMWKVVDRVISDFFTCMTPTVNKHTASLMEAALAFAQNQASTANGVAAAAA